MTQMSVAVTPPSTNVEAFGHMVIGKEVENRSAKKFEFDIRATSALPSYAKREFDSDKCFEQTSIPANVASGKYSVVGCMKQANTPSKMLYQKADVQNLSSATQCIPFGRGSLSDQCNLTSGS